MNQVKNDL